MVNLVDVYTSLKKQTYPENRKKTTTPENQKNTKFHNVRNRTVRSSRFSLANSVKPIRSGRFGLAVSVWKHFGHDISVHTQLITFVYLFK